MNQLIKGKTLPKTRSDTGKPRVLVAPLDWGLGHATRCIPVIHELLRQNCEVWLAGEGAQESLLRQEFPGLPFLILEGYRIRYARTASGLVRGMLIQAPGIIRTIRKENKWLAEKIKEHSFDAVISDNRYGLYHPSVPCIFITHQLLIKAPWGKWAENLLQKRNYAYINRFNSCWVPDFEGPVNLAGDLSHPNNKPSLPLNYIGPLSRFADDENFLPVRREYGKVRQNHLLIILSGPEPQRTLMEDLLLNEIAHFNGTATIVRGIPGAAKLIPSTNMLQFYNHLPADALKQEMLEAEYVIARCGYSTVMDLVALNKKSILIPTPGQTEQEYLSSYLNKQGIACTFKQKDFSLNTALQTAKSFVYKFPEHTDHTPLKDLILSLVTSLTLA